MAEIRIGILGDTHGVAAGCNAALAAMGKVDLILHTGDFAADARAIAKRTGIETLTVPGNCDYAYGVDEELLITLCGHRILLIHGQHHSVKRSLERIAEYAGQCGADICVFGHSHVSTIERIGNCLLINPGSPYTPRRGGPSCAVLTLEEGKAPRAELLAL
jgi:hypothetical protein